MLWPRRLSVCIFSASFGPSTVRVNTDTVHSGRREAGVVMASIGNLASISGTPTEVRPPPRALLNSRSGTKRSLWGKRIFKPWCSWQEPIQGHRRDCGRHESLFHPRCHEISRTFEIVQTQRHCSQGWHGENQVRIWTVGLASVDPQFQILRLSLGSSPLTDGSA